MKNLHRGNMLLLLIIILVSSGRLGYAVEYDHAYNPECVQELPEPQYGGGLIANPRLESKFQYGAPYLEDQDLDNGTKNLDASKRMDLRPGSPPHLFHLEKGKLYSLSAWLRLKSRMAHVAAVVTTPKGLDTFVGWAPARSSCWSMLKGGIVVNVTGPVKLSFKTNNSVIIRVTHLSLQAFTQDEWRSQQEKSIEKIRKSQVKFQIVDEHSQPLRHAKISIKQLDQSFPFGNAVSQHILNNTAYQDWFLSRFKYTVFENEMKWYSTERQPGKEDYTVPDAMLALLEKHNIKVRGHNILWSDPTYTPSWVKCLNSDELRKATHRRIHSIMARYKGRVIHWDVNNENLHFDFYEARLGKNASANFLKQAHQLDRSAMPFLNDYDTLERALDYLSIPGKYLERIKRIREQGYNGPLGIGIEGHFAIPNIAYVRAAMDMLATTGLPIWITELDVSKVPNQAMYLEQLIRELHSHPAVQGIVMWGSWSPKGCWRMCFTDNNFNNLPTGDVLDKVIKEFRHEGLTGTTDHNGYFRTSLYHGHYQAKIKHSMGVKSSKSMKFDVQPISKATKKPLDLRVRA